MINACQSPFVQEEQSHGILYNVYVVLKWRYCEDRSQIHNQKLITFLVVDGTCFLRTTAVVVLLDSGIYNWTTDSQNWAIDSQAPTQFLHPACPDISLAMNVPSSCRALLPWGFVGRQMVSHWRRTRWDSYRWISWIRHHPINAGTFIRVAGVFTLWTRFMMLIDHDQDLILSLQRWHLDTFRWYRKERDPSEGCKLMLHFRYGRFQHSCVLFHHLPSQGLTAVSSQMLVNATSRNPLKDFVNHQRYFASGLAKIHSGNYLTMATGNPWYGHFLLLS